MRLRLNERRQAGGGSIMIWAEFGSMGASDLAYINSRSDTFDYLNLIAADLIPFIDRFGRDSVIFQQDNCKIHISKKAKKLFAEQNIMLFDWPSCSPDLNPIENVWGMLAQRLYAANKRYFHLRDLAKAIHKEWHSLTQEYFDSLIDQCLRDKTKLYCVRESQ